MIRQLLIFAAIQPVAVAQAAAETAATPSDEARIFARLSDAEIGKRVQAVINNIDKRPEFVGLSIAVARGNHMIVDRGVGIADLEWNQPADAKTAFRIGSLTKQFTAAAIMKLKEQGKLGLDDPISKYLPDFDTEGHIVTIRQLLNHTSGIPDYTEQPGFVQKQSPLQLTEEELLKTIAGVPFVFQPGTKWAYSNTNYFLLGMIVEKLSGRSYADYMQYTFFKPLGLHYTRYGSEKPIIRERAQGYDFNGATGQRSNAPAIAMTSVGGAGGLVSSAGDLIRWQIALTSGRTVSPASFRQMITSTVKAGGGDALEGFGLMIDGSGSQRRIWHDGGISGFNSALSWLPAIGLRTAVISNSQGLPSWTVQDRIVGALTSDKPPPQLGSSPQPGVEAALRKLLGGIAAGTPDYDALTPQMADLTRAQLPFLQKAIHDLGMLKSLTFKSVDLSNADEYIVQFTNGALFVTISLDSQGKISASTMNPV